MKKDNMNTQLKRKKGINQMGSRLGLRYFVLKRLDSLMAIGESRHLAKQAIRAGSPEKRWSISTGKIHSYNTRRVYQARILAYVDWAITTYHVTRPVDLDTHADAWVSQYLRERMAQGKSPYTLATERSALRLFFGPHVASSVLLPKRKWSGITRSRVPVKQDRHFQPKHWPDHIWFAQAAGLRYSEMRDLRVGDVSPKPDGTLVVHVRRGKGGKAREVAVLAGYEQEILALIAGRDPKEHIFRHVPKNMDVQSYRRVSAQARYQQHAPEQALPPAEGERLKPTDYDATAVQEVAASLGHSRRRKAIVLNHYLR
jgi:integrase